MYLLQGLEHKHIQIIREWRNAQLNILRQQKPNTPEEQEEYWRKYANECATYRPKNYLYILNYDGRPIGYGGFVHIDWNLLEAEVSFLSDPARHDSETYRQDFAWFLKEVSELAKTPQWGLKALTGETFLVPSHRPMAEHFGCLGRAGFRTIATIANKYKTVSHLHRKEL